jgi:hypothetical protein
MQARVFCLPRLCSATVGGYGQRWQPRGSVTADGCAGMHARRRLLAAAVPETCGVGEQSGKSITQELKIARRRCVWPRWHLLFHVCGMLKQGDQ